MDTEKLLNILMFLAGVALFGGVLVLVFEAGRRAGAAGALEVVQKVNNSEALLNAIEWAGKNVDPSVVSGVLAWKEAIKARLPDQWKSVVDEVSIFIGKVTDGKPNTPIGLTPPDDDTPVLKRGGPQNLVR